MLKKSWLSDEPGQNVIHILPGKSDNHLFFMLRTWFYIYQASIGTVFKRKGAYITEDYHRFGVPLKMSKIVISTSLAISGQNK